MSEIRCVIECHTPPPAEARPPGCARLGIQAGKEVTQDAALQDQPPRFELTLTVELAPEGGAAVFKGRYAQGPRAAPFLYLCWGERSAGAWAGCGRSKLMLAGIPREQLVRAAQTGVPLRARVCLSNARGGPAFAALPAALVAWVE